MSEQEKTSETKDLKRKRYKRDLTIGIIALISGLIGRILVKNIIFNLLLILGVIFVIMNITWLAMLSNKVAESEEEKKQREEYNLKGRSVDQRDVDKAFNYASWSYLWLVVPLIGWILAGMAISSANRLLKRGKISETVKDKALRTKSRAKISIVLSILYLIILPGVLVVLTSLSSNN